MLHRAFRAASRLALAMARLPRQAAEALGTPAHHGEPRPRRLWQAMAVILPIAGLAAWALPQVTAVMSPSIDAWLLYQKPGPIARGDLVSFELSHPLTGPRPVRVTKYALCLPGQRIDWLERPTDFPIPRRGASPASGAPNTWDGWYFCEGRFLGISKPAGHDGRPLAHWRPAYTIIPPGLIYVGSAHASGFDSRYYGPIPIARLTRMGKLL